ncbi:MAG: hypothetical protein FJW36_23915 [Acidobacteria bacterium]|nr:hypothetical protein [Acidobacteriota bacterium]
MQESIQNKAIDPRIAGNVARRLVEVARDESLPPKVRDEFRGLADVVLRVGTQGLSESDRERLTKALAVIEKVVETKGVKQ